MAQPRTEEPDEIMTPDRFRQIAQLYGAALDLQPDKRAEFLKSKCADDEDLKLVGVAALTFGRNQPSLWSRQLIYM
jgi:hypothetical protein